MKKKPPKKPAESWRVISVPIWKAQVFVYCGPYEKLLERVAEAGLDASKMPDKTDVQSMEACAIRTMNDAIVWSREPMQLPLLVHELVHATIMILDARGCSDDTEAVAYTMEFLYKEATK